MYLHLVMYMITVIFMIILSFNSSLIGNEFKGFTLNWYLQMFNKETPNIYLVANKIDLSSKREVPLETIDNFCNEHQIKFFEISVKNSRNVNNMVQSFVRAYDNLAYPEK